MGSDDFISIEPTIGFQEEDDGHNVRALGEDGEIKEGIKSNCQSNMESEDYISVEPIIGFKEEDGHNVSASGEDGEINEGVKSNCQRNMGSDDFISIEPIIGFKEENDGHNVSALGEDGEITECKHEQDMDLESDPETSFVRRMLPESMVAEEACRNIQLEQVSGNASAVFISEDNVNNPIDEGSIPGVKRARKTYEDQQPCVHVAYKSLTKESKKKLIELMQQWSMWHAESKSSSNVSEELESGTETFFPALHVGSEKTSVSFWMETHVRNEDVERTHLDDDSVPLYDRGYTLGSTSLGGSGGSERIETLEASRCFNCGSYSHSLKECPKPRDVAAVNSARKQHSANRKSTPASCGQTRYYLEAKGKFHDLQAGLLGPETREALGIGKLDPPPWLNRMRQLGYPPGYLDEVEDADGPSGITIFGEEPKPDYEDGELPERADLAPSEKKMAVQFPGINGPIPKEADPFLWVNHTIFGSWDHSSLPVDRYKGPWASDGPQRGPAPVHGYSSHVSNNDYKYPHGHPGPSFGRSLSDRGSWHSHSPGNRDRSDDRWHHLHRRS